MVNTKALPKMICLTDYNGNYSLYIDAIYQVFHNDFIKHRTKFGSQVLKLKCHPTIQSREYTFYHMTHQGDVESERTPDLRRCERIPWARPTIENCTKFKLKFWEQIRSGNHRICIWMETDDNDNYYVIIDVRKEYVLLWTAFYAEYRNQVIKKEREYSTWHSKNKDSITTPDELLRSIQNSLQNKGR